MIVDVTNASELQDLGARAIDHAREHDLRELELRLAPGDYAEVPIGLGSVGRPALGRLTLAAADPDDPPQLTDISMRLHADHVRLQHLVFSVTRRSVPVLAVEAGRVELLRCAVVGCRLDGPAGTRLVELRAGAGASAATLEDCWFVDNHAPEYGTALVAAEGFARLDLVRTVFATNHARVALEVGARRVRLHGCLVVGEREGVFLGVTTSDATATIEESTLAWPTLDDLVATAHGRAVAQVRRSVLARAPLTSAPIKLEAVRYVDPPGLPLDSAGLRGEAQRAAVPRPDELAALLGLPVPAT